jgi:hypothetical protein
MIYILAKRIEIVFYVMNENVEVNVMGHNRPCEAIR